MDPTLSFVMALAALLLTVVNILVTVVLFKKAAGQVVVEMNTALLNPARALTANDKGTWGLDPLEYDPTGVELAKIVIENPGRTAATITKLDIRVEGSTDSDFAMGLRPIAIKQLSSTLGNTTADDRLPYRVEPYDQVVYLVDFWGVVNYVFAEEPQLRQINIWASVKVAGQPEPFDSRKHGYWTIRRGWISVLAPYTSRSAHSIILAELLDVFEDPGQNPYLADLATRLEQRISAESESQEITSALQQILGPGGDFDGSIFGSYNVWALITFGFNMKRRLEGLGEKVIWGKSVS